MKTFTSNDGNIIKIIDDGDGWKTIVKTPRIGRTNMIVFQPDEVDFLVQNLTSSE